MKEIVIGNNYRIIEEIGKGGNAKVYRVKTQVDKNVHWNSYTKMLDSGKIELLPKIEKCA